MPSGALMGRPKKQQRGKSPSPIRTIGFKATSEWSEWVERFAKANRTTVAGIIDRALADMAKAQEYPDAPPERIP